MRFLGSRWEQLLISYLGRVIAIIALVGVLGGHARAGQVAAQPSHAGAFQPTGEVWG